MIQFLTHSSQQTAFQNDNRRDFVVNHKYQKYAICNNKQTFIVNAQRHEAVISFTANAHDGQKVLIRERTLNRHQNFKH